MYDCVHACFTPLAVTVTVFRIICGLDVCLLLHHVIPRLAGGRSLSHDATLGLAGGRSLSHDVTLGLAGGRSLSHDVTLGLAGGRSWSVSASSLSSASC